MRLAEKRENVVDDDDKLCWASAAGLILSNANRYYKKNCFFVEGGGDVILNIAMQSSQKMILHSLRSFSVQAFF